MGTLGKVAKHGGIRGKEVWRWGSRENRRIRNIWQCEIPHTLPIPFLSTLIDFANETTIFLTVSKIREINYRAEGLCDRKTYAIWRNRLYSAGRVSRRGGQTSFDHW